MNGYCGGFNNHGKRDFLSALESASDCCRSAVLAVHDNLVAADVETGATVGVIALN